MTHNRRKGIMHRRHLVINPLNGDLGLKRCHISQGMMCTLEGFEIPTLCIQFQVSPIVSFAGSASRTSSNCRISTSSTC